MEQIAKQVPGPGADLTTKELRDLGCGRELGRFTLLRRIATGGMAEVYVAQSKGISGFEKRVAIKKILPQHSHNTRFIDMLVDEAKITVSLQHPNIAQVYELGLDEDTYFIVMEYVDGRPLNKLMQRVDERSIMTIPIPHAVHVMSEVSKGLDHAHKQKDQRGNPLCIVHRDISPQNVLISYQGDVKLIDFGIARAQGRAAQTSQGVIKGKLRYLAPEIAAGDEPDHRADIFCCGIVLFEMLTGEAMFAPKTDMEAIAMASEARVRSPRSRNPAVPEELDDICMRALKRDRAERYQTAKDLHLDLRKFLNTAHPTYVGSELGEFMQSMFVAEMAQEKRMDARAEQVAIEASVDFPAEEEPTIAGAPEELISAGSSRKAYKQLVTRLGIASAKGGGGGGSGGGEMRLIGADGGKPMGIVLDDSAARRPRIQSGSNLAKTPGTMPPQNPIGPDKERAPEPVVYGVSVPLSEIGGEPTRRTSLPIEASVLPTVTGPPADAEMSEARTPSWQDPSEPPSDGGDESTADSPRAAVFYPPASARTSSFPLTSPENAPTAYRPSLRPRSDRRHELDRSVKSKVSIRSGPAWGYIFAFVAVAVAGASFIFAGLAPSSAEDKVIVIPTRNAHVKAPIELQPITVGADPEAPRSALLRVEPDVEITVEVDGKRVAEKQRGPIALDGFELGRPHSIRVIAEGHRTESLKRELEPGTELSVKLRPEYGTIHVRGVSGATINADRGVVEGLSVVKIPMDSTVTVRVDRPGMRTWIEEVEVTSTEAIEISPPSPSPGRAPKGILVINSRPVSMVFIDGKKKGPTPVKVKLPPGKHKVTLKHPDGEKHTTTKVVTASKTTTYVYRWPK